MKLLLVFTNEEDGVTAIEYALIASLIAVGIVVSVDAVGNAVCKSFSTVSTGFGGIPVTCAAQAAPSPTPGPPPAPSPTPGPGGGANPPGPPNPPPGGGGANPPGPPNPPPGKKP
jgi:pilus assembly protein Flp/PilA